MFRRPLALSQVRDGKNGDVLLGGKVGQRFEDSSDVGILVAVDLAHVGGHRVDTNQPAVFNRVDRSA